MRYLLANFAVAAQIVLMWKMAHPEWRLWS